MDEHHPSSINAWPSMLGTYPIIKSASIYEHILPGHDVEATTSTASATAINLISTSKRNNTGSIHKATPKILFSAFTFYLLKAIVFGSLKKLFTLNNMNTISILI
jgi:hypothetical protein